MRCLIVTSIATGGGVTESVFTAIDMLRRDGIEVAVAVPTDFHFLDRLGQTGAEVFTLAGLAVGGVAWLPFQALRLAAVVRRSRADVVVVNNGRFVAALKRLTGRPVVAIYHGGKLPRFLAADRIITINEPQREALLAAGYPTDRVSVVDNALPLDELPPFRPRAPTTRPVIGTLRLLEPAKGVDTLIEAVALLRDRGIPLPARIGSSGSQEAKLRALVDRRGLGDLVTFLGWIDDKNAFYRSLDLYVLPSRAEEWGIGIAEANAAGLPVVSTDCLGPRRIVRNGVTGLLVPPDDPPALADAIALLAADPTRAAALAEAGWRHCAAHYTRRTIGPLYAAEIRKALRPSG